MSELAPALAGSTHLEDVVHGLTTLARQREEDGDLSETQSLLSQSLHIRLGELPLEFGHDLLAHPVGGSSVRGLVDLMAELRQLPPALGVDLLTRGRTAKEHRHQDEHGHR